MSPREQEGEQVKWRRRRRRGRTVEEVEVELVDVEAGGEVALVYVARRVDVGARVAVHLELRQIADRPVRHGVLEPHHGARHRPRRELRQVGPVRVGDVQDPPAAGSAWRPAATARRRRSGSRDAAMARRRALSPLTLNLS